MQMLKYLAALLALVSAPTVAAPEVDYDKRWFASGMLGFNFSDASDFNNGPAGFLSVGRGVHRNLALELSLFGSDLDVDDVNATYEKRGVGINGLVFITKPKQWRPYGLVGLNYQDISFANVDYNGFGTDLGLGIIRAGEKLDIRAEMRYRLDFHDEDNTIVRDSPFYDFSATVGIVLPFGGSKASAPEPEPIEPVAVVEPEPTPQPKTTAKPAPKAEPAPIRRARPRPEPKPIGPDEDYDGIGDSADQCQQTFVGFVVDERGCATANQKVRLDNIQFATDSSELNPRAQTQLNYVALMMINQPTMVVEISGHTDAQGDAKYNRSLSAVRASAARVFLKKRGIDGARVMAKGYGEKRPVATNDTEKGRARNRRVELKIIGK